MRRIVFFCILPLLLWETGCGSTYPKATLAESLIRLCKEEYDMDVSVQMAGKTLGVYVPLEKLFDSTLRLSPEVGDQLDGVILATSRVVLSTDDPPDFYVVVAEDKRIPGVELRLIRYVQDIRRLYYGSLSRNEYTKRMLFEFGLGLGIFTGEEHAFHLEEIKFEKFLAAQMAQRMKARLDEERELLRGMEIRSVRGEFIAPDPMERNASGRFVITLEAQELGVPLWEIQERPDERRVLTTALEVLLEVLKGYRFTAFDSVELKTPFLKQPFILSGEILELYRRKKVDLSELLLPNPFNLSPHDAELILKK